MRVDARRYLRRAGMAFLVLGMSLSQTVWAAGTDALRTPLQLALNDGAAKGVDVTGEPGDDWHESWLTANKTHKYLGIGSLLLAGLTVLTAPDDEDEGAGGGSDDSLHQGLANGALALGVGAVATGLAFHFDDIKYANGLGDPDNLHALLGVVGTTGYALAVANGGEGGHAAAGIVGALSMAAAIKIEW